MMIWKLKYGDKHEAFNDIAIANRCMLDKQCDEIELSDGEHRFTVNFKTGQFTAGGKDIPHNVFFGEEPILRFISFKRNRHTVDIHTGEPVEIREEVFSKRVPFIGHTLVFTCDMIPSKYEIFIGWQTTVNNNNIKRMLKIYDNMTYELVEKS
jgi:hypothetical protein